LQNISTQLKYDCRIIRIYPQLYMDKYSANVWIGVKINHQIIQNLLILIFFTISVLQIVPAAGGFPREAQWLSEIWQYKVSQN
jgi:hypothetical protein